MKDHVDMISLPNGGCHLLDGLSHASKGAQLLVHQSTPPPLPLNSRSMINNLVRAIKDVASDPWVSGYSRQGSLENMVSLPVARPPAEDGMHLRVVIGIKDNVGSCDWNVRSSEASRRLVNLNVALVVLGLQ